MYCQIRGMVTQKHNHLGIVQPYLTEIRSADGFQKPVDDTVFDCGRSYSRSSRYKLLQIVLGKKSEGTVNAFEFHQLGIYHQDQNKGNTDLTDDTGDDKINIVTEMTAQNVVSWNSCV